MCISTLANIYESSMFSVSPMVYISSGDTLFMGDDSPSTGLFISFCAGAVVVMSAVMLLMGLTFGLYV
jgi:hypothetical protein